MRKFAPIAMLMALLAALLMGGAASAQAGTAAGTDDGWKCVNKKSVKLVSCTLNDITINVGDVRVLSDNEINVLEKSLNNTNIEVKILNGDINVAKDVVVKIFKNDLNIIIFKEDVKICVLAHCK